MHSQNMLLNKKDKRKILSTILLLAKHKMPCNRQREVFIRIRSLSVEAKKI